MSQWKRNLTVFYHVDRDGVDLATSYRLHGPRIESWYKWHYPHPSISDLGSTHT